MLYCYYKNVIGCPNLNIDCSECLGQIEEQNDEGVNMVKIVIDIVEVPEAVAVMGNLLENSLYTLKEEGYNVRNAHMETMTGDKLIYVKDGKWHIEIKDEYYEQ